LTSSDEKRPRNLKSIPKTEDAIAVALHQVSEVDRAPKVVASGRGIIAEQILEVAFSMGIKVREDADLAQVLSAVNEETEIPVEAFAAVAEILVYLYQANNETPPNTIYEQSEDQNERTNSINDLTELLTKKWRESGET
tara:strand:+ start:317 stop:733 length:417 start_codon:yes stop_codon:yes gene_type:complete